MSADFTRAPATVAHQDSVISSSTSRLPALRRAYEHGWIISRGGTVSLGQHVILAAEILPGRQVGIRIEPELTDRSPHENLSNFGVLAAVALGFPMPHPR